MTANPDTAPSADDSFDKADFYSFSNDEESLSHEDVYSLLRDLSEPEGVVVYAWRRRVVPADYAQTQAEWLSNHLADAWLESWELGDPEEAVDVPEEVEKKLREACELMARLGHVWCCEVIGRREFTTAEVTALLTR